MSAEEHEAPEPSARPESDNGATSSSGNASQSVLKNLGQTVDLPRVHLPDTDVSRLEPLQKPDSPDIPDRDANSRYQLQGEIARGGMGVIIKGRDVDLGRELAIKVLQSELKDRPEVIQRFIEEAQIGGQMQHPGIAPVYELGQFSDQRPFFSMKLVEGESLSKLLAERQEPAQDRARFLRIFEQVCQTMGYAHARGVIHRDLKPANIMVGAFGEVQVMDWGLAKVLPSGGVADEKAAQTKQKELTVLRTRRSVGSDAAGLAGSDDGLGSGSGSGSADTQMGSVMGTPAYMPPEQALGEIDQLNQRSDVFGLGAILCEILTGKPPYVADDVTAVFRLASRGKLDDAFKRLDDCGADAELITLAKQCLATEPDERPKDGGALAERVSGYLEAVETRLRETELAKVDAQVRAEELGRRQRVVLGAGTAVVASLLLGIGVSLWQMLRANEAEAKTAEALAQVIAEQKKTSQALALVTIEKEAAVEARDEATSLADFLTDIFQGPDPFEGPESFASESTIDPDQIKVIDLLIPAAQRLESSFASQPARRASLQAALAKTYHGIGLYDKAIAVREQVRDYYLAEHGPEHADTLTAIVDLARSYSGAGRYQEALELAERVYDLRSSLLGPEAPDTLIAKRGLAGAYWYVGRRDEGRELMEEVLAQLREVLGEDDPETLKAMSSLAWYYADAGRYDEAIKMNKHVLDLRRKLLGEEHPDTLSAISSLASSYHASGLYDKAIPLREQCSELRRKVNGPEHPDTLGAITNLALSYSDVGRYDEAISLQEQCLELRRKVLGPEHPDTLRAINNLALSYKTTGRYDEAIPMQEQCLELRRKVLGAEHPDKLKAMSSLASSYREVRRYDEAIPLQEQCLELRRKVLGAEHPDKLSAIGSLALSYKNSGQLAEAIQMEEELLPLLHKLLGPEHSSTLGSMTNLAMSYNRAGRFDEAIELQERALEIKRRVLPPKHPFLASAFGNLADLYSKTKRGDEAIKLLEERLALTSDDPNAFNAAAWVLATNPAPDGTYPDAERAVEWARKACELNLGNGMWENTLGVACYRAEQWQEAIDALTNSIEHGFDLAHNWLFIAMAHWQLDDQDEAQQWYDKSLTWKADHPDELKADAELQAFFAEAAELMGES